MDIQQKNELVTTIARKENKSFFEVDAGYILGYHKRLKIDQLTLISDDVIVNGFVATNGHTYRTNRDDQINIIGKAIQLIFKPEITSVPHKTEDSGYVVLTRDEWIENVFSQGLSHKEKALHKYNTLKMKVEAATTEEEILLLNWEETTL